MTDDPEELQGTEITRVHFVNPDPSSGSFVEDLKRVRQARSAWRVAKALGRLALEHPPVP